MITRLKLLQHVARQCTTKQPSRKLYTDHIYPYPYNYFNNTLYPSRHQYRETWPPSPWQNTQDLLAQIGFRIFWTYFWFKFFSDPGVFFGHFHPPDPSTWTDAELGIPADDAGTYKEWLMQHVGEE